MTMRPLLNRRLPSIHPVAARASEDLFADTRMPFGDHLEELRWRLWRAVAGFGLIGFLVFTLDFVGFVTGTPVGVAKPVKDFIARPVEEELAKFYRRRVDQVLAALDKDPTLVDVNRPTGFVRMG